MTWSGCDHTHRRCVTEAKPRHVALPFGAGTIALVSLDNGLDHTRPNIFGPKGRAVALHNDKTPYAAFPDRFYVSPNLEKLVAARKPGMSGADGALDSEATAMFETAANPVELTGEQVRERVLSALAEEAQLMLDGAIRRGAVRRRGRGW